jgi:hypothetical protein
MGRSSSGKAKPKAGGITVALPIASRMLREVLADVAQQPEDVQDRSAEVLRELLDQSR